MDTILRAAAIYLLLLVVFRIAGKRTLSEATTFDLVLLLIISEATQQAMVDDDNSFTNSALLVVTLVGLDIAVSLIKSRWKRVNHALDGHPLVLMWDGRLLREPCDRERIGPEDILRAAREHHGLESIDQVKHAVLEASGGITIIPR